jgi:dCMP deaminase
MRIESEELYLDIASLIATRATCPRRQVGCVLVDSRNRILSTGYNGVASGRKHCIDHACPGADFASGEGLDKCEALHAEQNAILLLKDPYVVHTAYLTVTPCLSCIKLLLGTSCQRIIAREEYRHPDAYKWWTEAGRTWQIRAKK